MNAAEVWQRKDDETVVTALRNLTDYTDEGQAVIRAEAEHRGLTEHTTFARDAPDVAVTAAPAVPTSSNPFVRLWRGEFSLPVTYWAWGVVGNFVVVPTFTTWVGLVAKALGFPLGVLLLALWVVMMVGWFVLILVAVWRSAEKYRGDAMWSRMARASVGFGLLRLVVEVGMYFTTGSR